MADEKKCMVCNCANSAKWIERKNIVGTKAYFCGPKCYQEYKKRGEASGVCEFC